MSKTSNQLPVDSTLTPERYLTVFDDDTGQLFKVKLDDLAAAISSIISGTPVGGGNDYEIIAFSTSGDTIIEWTEILESRFGDFPSIDLWAYDDTSSTYYKANFSIEQDTSVIPKQFIVKNGGGGLNGFIKIT